MKQPALVAIILVALVLLSVPLASRDAPTGYHRDDVRAAVHAYDPRLIHADLAILDPDHDALLLIAPDVPYSNAETATLRTFLEDGGRALVFAAGPSSQTTVDSLQVGITFPAAGVYSPAHGDSPLAPYIGPTAGWPDLPDDRPIQQPLVIIGGEAVLQTTPLTWLDLDGDLRPDLQEPQGAWSIAVTVPVGQGELLVAGGIAFFDDPDYRGPFLDWLTQDGQRRLVIDEAHHIGVDPLQAANALAGVTTTPWLILVAATVFGTVIWATQLVLRRRRRLRRPRTQSPWHEQAWKELP